MKPRTIAAIIIVCTLIAGVVFATLNNNLKENGSNKFEIATSINPLYVMALNLTEGAKNVEVTSITAGTTGCPHHYQLTPKNMVDIENSDVFFVNGLGIESYIDDLLEKMESKIVTLTDEHDHEHEHEDEDAEHEHEDEDSEHDHEHEEDCDHEHEEGEECNHNHGGTHVWLNLEIYKEQLIKMAEQLVTLNPENSEVYRANLETYKAKIESLEEKQSKLNKLEGTKTVVFHDSSECLLDGLGIEILKNVDIESETGISAATLKETIELIKENNIKYVVTDPAYNQNVVKQVQKETNVKVIEVNSLADTFGAGAKDAYVTGMEKNLSAFEVIE